MNPPRFLTGSPISDAPMQRLQGAGQSLWLEYLRRDFLLQGALRNVIDRDGVRGVVSTPTTFAQSIAWTGQYDAAVAEWVRRGTTDPVNLYERLAFADVESALELLRDVYERSDGRDGYVCLAVAPVHADDPAALLADAKRIWRQIARPNLMISIYATAAGMEALPDLVAEGINTNVTGITSLKDYAAANAAYRAGLARREGDLGGLAAVASLAVGAIDPLVDGQLASVGSARGADDFAGQAAIAIARLAYRDWKRHHSGSNWTRLAARGARPQRLLYGALGSQGMSEALGYVEKLIGPDTVLAMPVTLLDGFRVRGRTDPAKDHALPPEAVLAALSAMGLDLNGVLSEARRAELERYRADYGTLLAALERKRSEIQEGLPPLNSPRTPN